MAGAKSVRTRVVYRLGPKSTTAAATIDGLSDVASPQRHHVVRDNADMSSAMSLAPRSSTSAGTEVVAGPVAPTPS